MKYINKLLTVAFVAFFVTSCNEAIEITQPGRLTPDKTFITVSDLEGGLLGAYSNLDLTQQIQFNASFTDELSIGFDSGGQGVQTEYSHILNPTSAMPAAMWTRFYVAINAATRVIEAATLVEPSTDQRSTYNTIVGQAHAIRAYAHFTLLSYFSPNLTDDSSLGVIAVNFIPSVDAALPRNTTGEVWAAVEADLNQAASLIDPSFADNSRMTQDFVTALRARIALYRKQYSTADQLAAQLINKYPLADRDQYINMFWEDADDTELIFKLTRNVGDPYDGQGATGSPAAGGWAGANFAFVSAGVDGSPYFEMGRTLFNLLSIEDVRFQVNIHPSSTINANYPNVPQDQWYDTDILVINKYPGALSQGKDPLMNDLKIFRVSEMYLIRAEAAAQLGDLSGAANFIDQIRDARFGSNQTAPSFSSQQDALKGVLDERRIELCFEGHRWLDLKRLGADAGAQIDRDPLDCAITGACTLSATDHRFTLPIPLLEINGNNVIATQQNPGY